MSNSETDQQDTHGGGEGGQLTAIQFKKSESRITQWTINDVLGNDPLLNPVEFVEVNPEGGSSSGASTSRTGP